MAVAGVVLSAKITYSTSVRHMSRLAFRGTHRAQIAAVAAHLKSVLLWDQRAIDRAAATGGAAHVFTDSSDISDAIENLLAQVAIKLGEKG